MGDFIDSNLMHINDDLPIPIHKRGLSLRKSYWQQIDFIHDIRHLCTPTRIDERRAMSRGFSGGKQVNTFYKGKKLRSRLFILDNRK